MREVKICDVSLRDGMQILNRHAVIPLEARLQLVEALVRAGVPYIEVGSFVNPRVVPAMRDTAELLRSMPDYDGQIAALAPTVGYYRKLREAEKVNTVALFVAASEEYSRANTRMSIAEALDRAGEVAAAAREDDFRLRGYVSYAFRDRSQPRELTPVELVDQICGRLVAMGCETVALSDTDGKATPGDIERTVGHVAESVGYEPIGVHLHDRRGMGLTNAYVAYQAGVRTFDASVGGIGGNITVRHSVGNIATEELAAMFATLGVETGIDIEPLIEAGCRVSQMADYVGDPPPPSKLILDELAQRRAEIEETEGVDADLTLKELVTSLVGLLERPRQLTVKAVGDKLADARDHVTHFLETPSNRTVGLVGLVLALAVSTAAVLVVRVFPAFWSVPSGFLTLTLLGLGIILFVGLGVTALRTFGPVHLRPDLSDEERKILRRAIGDLSEKLPTASAATEHFEV